MKHKTKLQQAKRRQGEIPAAFAEATLAAAIKAKPQDFPKHARKVARLRRRGEL